VLFSFDGRFFGYCVPLFGLFWVQVGPEFGYEGELDWPVFSPHHCVPKLFIVIFSCWFVFFPSLKVVAAFGSYLAIPPPPPTHSAFTELLFPLPSLPARFFCLPPLFTFQGFWRTVLLSTFPPHTPLPFVRRFDLLG